MLNRKKFIVLFIFFTLVLSLNLSAMQTTVYVTGGTLLDDTTQGVYYGGEVRCSFLNHIKPFVAVGAAAGCIKDREDNTNRYYIRPNTNSYLNTLKAGVELRMSEAGNYSCGVAVYGLFFDQIVNSREDGKRVSNHFLKAGLGCEISAIYNFRLAGNSIVKTTNSSCVFRISGGYTFDNTLDLEVSCGVIFRFDPSEA